MARRGQSKPPPSVDGAGKKGYLPAKGTTEFHNSPVPFPLLSPSLVAPRSPLLLPLELCTLPCCAVQKLDPIELQFLHRISAAHMNKPRRVAFCNCFGADVPVTFSRFPFFFSFTSFLSANAHTHTRNAHAALLENFPLAHTAATTSERGLLAWLRWQSIWI